MPKKLIDLSGVPAGLMNRSRASLGPGVLRLAADSQTDEADVFIYGDIGGWWGGVTAEQFAKDVAALEVETLNVRLNSPGGLVFEGVAIYNALVRHSASVVVHIDGIAASIASVIAMAGDEIRISEGAHVMIHKPWSLAIGDAEAMRKEAEVLDDLEAGLIDIYAARTGNKRDQLEQWVAAETWFRGQKAVDEGFADVMVPAKKKEKKDAHARSAMLPNFLHTPQDIILDAGEAPGIREFERLLRDAEGMSIAQARRVAGMARELSAGLRDEAAPPAPRDAAVPDLERLAAHIRSL